jgi:hypothetical protein
MTSVRKRFVQVSRCVFASPLQANQPNVAGCITRNLGCKALMNLVEAPETEAKWQCFVCKPEQLANMEVR